MAKYDTKQFKLEQFTKVGESQLFSKKLEELDIEDYYHFKNIK